MRLECIYTMANAGARLQFTAMERSLRATGCDLPLRVFPYADGTFDLPPNASWVRPPLSAWLREREAHPMCDKLHCLTQANVLFTDTDIVYLENPCDVLAPHKGFVVADTEWNKPRWTFTRESARILGARSSVWMQRVFNAGHFACDRALYSEEALKERILAHEEICLRFRHDQPGTNLLVALSGVPVTNLNLPPSPMESTWAGDYAGDPQPLWVDPARKPYFVHWAGPCLDEDRPINELFTGFLTEAERKEWNAERSSRIARQQRDARWPFGVRLLNALVRLLYPRYRVLPRE